MIRHRRSQYNQGSGNVLSLRGSGDLDVVRRFTYEDFKSRLSRSPRRHRAIHHAWGA